MKKNRPRLLPKKLCGNFFRISSSIWLLSRSQTELSTVVYSLDIVGSHLFPQTPHAVRVVSAGVSAATRPGVLRGRWHHLHHGLGLLQWGGSRRGPCRGLSHGSGRVRHLHTDKSHYFILSGGEVFRASPGRGTHSYFLGFLFKFTPNAKVFTRLSSSQRELDHLVTSLWRFKISLRCFIPNVFICAQFGF